MFRNKVLVTVEMYSGVLENIQFYSDDPLTGNHNRIFFKCRDGHLGRRNRALFDYIVSSELTKDQIVQLTILLGQADGVVFGDGLYSTANVVRGFRKVEF